MFSLFETFYVSAYAVFCYLFDPIVYLFLSKDLHAREYKRNVLVVRTDSIGDFVVWLDAAKDLRRIFTPNEYTITLIANKDWADLAKPFSYWDEIILIDRNKFIWDLAYRWKFLRNIARRHFDITIHPIFSRIMLLGDSIVRITRSSERIGWDLYEDLNSPYFFSIKNILMKGWYTRLIGLDRSKIMELQKNAQFMIGLGLKDFKSAIPKLIISEQNIPKGLPQEYFIIVPDAGWKGREWPMQNFMVLARRIQQTTSLPVIFLGAKKLLDQDILNSSQGLDLVNLMGKTSISEYAQCIAGAKFILGNESSATHIATALNVLSFSIVGGGHWGRFVPYICDASEGCKPVIINFPMDCYRCEWMCKYPKSSDGVVKCIENVEIEYAWKVINPFLVSKT